MIHLISVQIHLKAKLNDLNNTYISNNECISNMTVSILVEWVQTGLILCILTSFLCILTSSTADNRVYIIIGQYINLYLSDLEFLNDRIYYY